MECFIYKGNRKPDTYLYVVKQNDFSEIPQVLLELMGSLEQVLSVDLAKKSKLANADILTVTDHLTEQGYYIQLPSQVDVEN